MNSPARRFGPLPPVPPELLGALRGALDLAFALTTPDAVIVGPVNVPTPAEPTPTMPGRTRSIRSGSAAAAVATPAQPIASAIASRRTATLTAPDRPGPAPGPAWFPSRRRF
jgi:hypothetical protein